MVTREKPSKQGTIISPVDDWITANLTLSAKLSAYHSNGQFVVEEIERSIDLLEYAKDRSHNHNNGGDAAMVSKQAINRFFELPNVEKVGLYRNKDEDYLAIIVTEDQDDLSFQLAKIKIEIQDQYPNYNFEIRYSTIQNFNLDRFPSDIVFHTRG